MSNFELEQIKLDTGLYVNLLTDFVKTQNTASFIYGLFPYLSLYTLETLYYFEKNNPNLSKKLSRQYMSIISSSRHRTKLFDVKDGTFDFLDYVQQFQIKMFHDNKSFVARIFQPDLSLFIYKGHIVSSTHSNLLSIGFGIEELQNLTAENWQLYLGQQGHKVAIELSSYAKNLSNEKEFKLNKNKIFIDKTNGSELFYIDMKSKNLYSKIFNAQKTHLFNFALLDLLCTTNFMCHIFNQSIIQGQHTIFKLKFVILYHLLISLKKLQSYGYSQNILSDQSKDYFLEITKDEECKDIVKQKKLRNIFVHYELTNSTEYSIKTLTIPTLVEHHFKERSFSEVDKMLTRQLFRISTILEEWMNWNPNKHRLQNVTTKIE